MENYIYYFAIAATASRLLPLSVGAARWRHLTRPSRLIFSVVLIAFIGDVAMLYLGRVLSRNNLWVVHTLILIQTPLLFLAFREWAGKETLRRFMGIAAGASVVLWIAITLFLETPTRFARVTGPGQAALISVAAGLVLIERGLSVEGPILRADWFWACLALLMLHSVTALHQPILDLFTGSGAGEIPVWTVLKGIAILTILSNIMLVRALLLSGQEVMIPVRTA